MGLSAFEEQIVNELTDGLPLVSEPYRAIADKVGGTCMDVRICIQRLQDRGVLNRFGVIVNHRALGYRSNAMVVWNVPDDLIHEVAPALAKQPSVTLCYRRPRRQPNWPYNLFTMIHGRNQAAVEAQVSDIIDRLTLTSVPHAVLFSPQCFKQRGPRYHTKVA
jgi:siroheme decarboxylase